MNRNFASMLVGIALGGCVDAEPLSPGFEQRIFNTLGGLEVGEALTLLGADAQAIVLQGGEGGARYVFIPFLAAEEGSIRLRVDVRGEDLISLRNVAPEPPSATVQGFPAAERERAEHLRLRRYEQERMSSLLSGNRPNMNRAPSNGPGVSQQVTAAPSVGELVSLQVINRSPENPSLCDNPLQRTGRITAVSENAILVEDVLNPLPLAAADLQRLADEYDQLVHPVALENFGAPTDIDGNGRVYIFMTSALNEFAARAGGGTTVGFTFALDLLPRTTGSCAASNEGEIFYLIAPDPAGTLGVQVSEELVRRLTTTIIVHELQHMINAGRRLYVVPDAREFEELWLNEGLSHVAEELVFYAATGLRPRTDIGWDLVNSSPERLEGYHRFVRDNMSIYSNYLGSPDDESLMGKSPQDDDFTTRGAAWAFLRYLADQTPTEDADLFYELVNSPVGGLENLERVLDLSPLTWMQRWTVSNYTENRPASDRIDPRFQQPSWDFQSIYEGEMGFVPLSPRGIDPDGSTAVALRGGGSSYLELRTMPNRQAILSTTRISPPVFGEFRASVLRIE